MPIWRCTSRSKFNTCARIETSRADTGSSSYDLVFATGRGTPLNQSDTTKRFKEFLEAFDLQEKRFHDTRHSCATYLLSGHAPLIVVKAILGHSSISLTAKTYAHVMPALKEEALSVFDRKLAASAQVEA
jgi:integrase